MENRYEPLRAQTVTQPVRQLLTWPICHLTLPSMRVLLDLNYLIDYKLFFSHRMGGKTNSGIPPSPSNCDDDTCARLQPCCHEKLSLKPYLRYESQDNDNADTATENCSPFTTSSPSTAQFMNVQDPSFSSSSFLPFSTLAPSSSFTPRMDIMSLRRPILYRDRGFAFLYVLHLVGLILVFSLKHSEPSRGKTSQHTNLPFYAISSCLFLIIICGSAFTYFIVLRALLHNRAAFGLLTRRQLLSHASYYSFVAQTVLFFALFLSLPLHLPSTVIILGVLFMNMWREHQYWRRRVREQEKFVVALGEMMSEILISSLPLCRAISWTVLLQASFLLLWACGFASFYSSASGLSSFPAFLLLFD